MDSSMFDYCLTAVWIKQIYKFQARQGHAQNCTLCTYNTGTYQIDTATTNQKRLRQYVDILVLYQFNKTDRHVNSLQNYRGL